MTSGQVDIPSTKLQLVGSRAVFFYAIIAAVFIPMILSIGEGGPTTSRMLVAMLIVLDSSWMPVIYLAGSLGLGQLSRRWLPQTPVRWVIELGVGFTLTLTLTHLLGIMGVLNTWSAWVITGGGCFLLLSDLGKTGNRLNHAIGQTKLTLIGVIFVLGCVLIVLMSCNPPGSVWDTEFNSYDSLSYHLELPREWLAGGRIEPVAHNVYAYLPSYIESAYLHFAYLSNSDDFLSAEARVTYAASLFSALLTIVSAISLRSVVEHAIRVWNIQAGSLSDHDRAPAMCARAMMVCTPWIAVVGSIAYNEMGVIFLGIGALACAVEMHRSEHTLKSISVIAAFIVGGACSCKPTAIFLLAPSIAVILLAGIPVRKWIMPIAISVVVGCITIAPWLIRNEIATGNPVFPHLSSLFGDGHWTDAQHVIYRKAHTFDGSLSDRIAMLVLPDTRTNDPVQRFRGFTHIQWALTPLLGLLATVLLLARMRTHRIGFVIALALGIPTIAWMFLTHLQSRFLVPIAPMLIFAMGMAFASIPRSNIRNRSAALVALLSLAWTTFIASNQLNKNPFGSLVLSTAQFTGELDMTYPSWTSSINTLLEPDETIYLLGDATPFYVRPPVRYNTVYDRWIIEDAIVANPNNPERWTDSLSQAGVDVVMISYFEIRRFYDSGWLPDSINLEELQLWIDSLGEPIYEEIVPGIPTPIRAAYRLPNSSINHD